MEEKTVEVENATDILRVRIGEVVSIGGSEVYEVVQQRLAEVALTVKDETQSKTLYVRRMLPLTRGRR